MPFKLSKTERLSHKNSIDTIFLQGKKCVKQPLMCIFLEVPEATLHQVMFSVSKKKFKKAVDRNRMKRWMREAYRLNKSMIADQKPMHMAWIYIGNEKANFTEIEASVQSLFQCISERSQEI